MIKDYVSLAFGNMKHRGVRTWLTMLGIFIGIAAVVSLISMGAGLREAITGQFSSLSVDKLTIQNAETGFGPPGATAVKKLNSHDIKIIESVNGISEVVSRLIRMVKLEYNGLQKYHFVVSMPSDSKKLDLIYSSMSINVESGKLLQASDTGKVVLGHDYTRNEFGKEIRVGSNVKINGKTFEVTGILKAASTFQVNSAILMSEDDLNSLLNIKDEADIIVAQVTDKEKIQEVADEIRRKLRQDRNEKIGEEDFTVQSPIQALGTVNTILNIINIIVSGIAAISLLVGGLGIANTMYTSVLERTKEIGTMKAVGAKNKDIMYIFVIESGLLGLIGGIVGAIIGLAMAYLASVGVNSYFGDNIFIPQLNIPLVLGAILFSLIIGLASGLLPALQASKLKPVEALRK